VAFDAGDILMAGVTNCLANLCHFLRVGKGHIFRVFQIMAAAVVTEGLAMA
jgi:hypothetical protein